MRHVKDLDWKGTQLKTKPLIQIKLVVIILRKGEVKLSIGLIKQASRHEDVGGAEV
jgi:hypothetical protein